MGFVALVVIGVSRYRVVLLRDAEGCVDLAHRRSVVAGLCESALQPPHKHSRHNHANQPDTATANCAAESSRCEPDRREQRQQRDRPSSTPIQNTTASSSPTTSKPATISTTARQPEIIIETVCASASLRAAVSDIST
jgi:hypothetical protein